MGASALLKIVARDESLKPSELIQERDSLQEHSRLLHNLLAICHGDGGHYTAEHGLKKSVEDAIELRNKMIQERDSLRQQISNK